MADGFPHSARAFFLSFKREFFKIELNLKIIMFLTERPICRIFSQKLEKQNFYLG